MAGHNLKLIYFDIPGFAETSRVLLKIGGLPFEDFRYPIQFVEGQPVRPEFEKDKAAGNFPFGQVPVLEVDGVKICQSRAIERYIASETGLLGSNSLETAQIDAFGEQLLDIRSTFLKSLFNPDAEAKKTGLAAFFETELGKQLDILENTSGDNGHLFGKKLSLADVQFFTLVIFFQSANADAPTKLVASHPKLQKVFNTVASHPAVAAHFGKYKLTYFDIRGLAETTRYLFKIAGVNFEDFRYPIQRLPDGSVKRPEFDEAKARGDFLFGQVPVLEVGGQQIVQSRAIERFVAQQLGFDGSCPVQKGKIDAFGEQIFDLRTAYFKSHHTQGDEAKAAAKAAFYNDLSKNLGIIENAAGNDGFLVGNKISLADVQLFSTLEVLELDNATQFNATLSQHPKLQKIVQTIAAIPNLAKYRAERKVTPF